jgi:hypothetical protein
MGGSAGSGPSALRHGPMALAGARPVGDRAPMRVLLMDSHPGAAEPAADALTSAGHEVVRCRDPFSPTHPCAGYDNDCPIDHASVDVALDVRGRPLPRPTAGEHGVVCASRAGVPVVIAGQVAFQPFETLTTVELAGTRSVVTACEAAVASVDEADRGKVAAAVLAATGLATDVERRAGEDLLVTVHDADDPGKAAVAAHQAARTVDRDSRTVTIRTAT